MSTLTISMPSGTGGKLPTMVEPTGDIDHLIFAFDEKVMMVGNVRVEIGLCALDGEDAEHSGLGKLMQCIVHRRQRNRHIGTKRLFVQFFGRKVPVTLGKDQAGERDTLTGRP